MKQVFNVNSTRIKCPVDVIVYAIEAGWLCIINNKTKNKGEICKSF